MFDISNNPKIMLKPLQGLQEVNNNMLKTFQILKVFDKMSDEKKKHLDFIKQQYKTDVVSKNPPFGDKSEGFLLTSRCSGYFY